MDMKINEVTEYTPELKNTIDKFLKMLTGKEQLIAEEGLKALIAATNSHLFVAWNEHHTA